MSHVRTVIEPAPGLTVIVGPNNCGKSAIVNALQCLAYNAQGKAFVRHGSRFAKVTVDTAEGDRIEWCRERDQVSYSINGERTHRGVIPDSLPTKLRLNEVKGDDNRGSDFDIHFAEQKQPIFLLGQEKQAALFFASSSDTGYLLKMQQTWKSRTNDQKRELKRLNDKLIHDRAVFEAYAPVEEVEAQVRSAEMAFAQLQKLEAEREGLASWMERSRGLLAAVQLQSAQQEALSTLEPPPQLTDTESCRRLATRWRRLSTDAGREAERLTVLDLPVEPALADTADLADLTRRIAAKDRFIRKIAAKAAIVETLAAPPTLTDTAGLVQMISRTKQLQQRIEEAEAGLARLTADSGQVQAELRHYLADNPQCPTCGGTIEAERFLTHQEHAHA